MKSFTTALYVELRKTSGSRTPRVITALLVAGIALLTGALVAAARAGNEQIIAELGPLIGAPGWGLLTGVAGQITAAGALLGFGAALSWSFGREFTDGTVTGLFAQPVTRPTIAQAKLCIHLLWVGVVAVAMTSLLLAAGAIFGFGHPDGEALTQLVDHGVLIILTGVIAMPAGWAATLGRGPLPGIATTLAVLVVAQVTAIAVPGGAAWMPFAAPALWAIQPEAVHLGQLLLVGIVPAVFGALTCLAWQRLQLDR